MSSNSKAQSAVELIALISFAMLIFTGFYLVIFKNDISVISERINKEFMQISDGVAYEINIASSMGDGYSKNFTLKEDVLGQNYTIIVDNYLVIVNSSQTYSSPIIIENITGTINPGNNYIENRKGIVYAT